MGPKRQRFRSLSTSLPDVDGNKGLDLPFNCLSSFDPIDELNDKDINEFTENIKTRIEEP